MFTWVRFITGEIGVSFFGWSEEVIEIEEVIEVEEVEEEVEVIVEVWGII